MQNYVFTIGRQLGSGGTTLGKALANRFDFQYIDKEVLVKAAESMNIDAITLEELDEKAPSIWNILARTAAYEVPYVRDEWYIPDSAQLFKIQSKIMKEAVYNGPCVIIGRCSPYLFRNYEKHFSVFLHSSEESRLARLKKRLGDNKSEKELKKMLEKSDKSRAVYFNNFTGQKWLDLRCYDLTLDTTRLTDEQVEESIVQQIFTRFPELANKQ